MKAPLSGFVYYTELSKTFRKYKTVQLPKTLIHINKYSVTLQYGISCYIAVIITWLSKMNEINCCLVQLQYVIIWCQNSMKTFTYQ